MTDSTTFQCPISGDTENSVVHVYYEPPQGETAFSSVNKDEYCREIRQFKISRHYISTHKMDLSSMYSGDYVDSNYQGLEGIRKTFNKIINLPPEKSDNVARVQRINEIADSVGIEKKVLDIGSGLGVFPYQMKKTGWNTASIDPDERAVSHIKEDLGINAYCGDFMDVELEEKFSLLSLNKVLEHVEVPVSMLKRCHNFLEEGGIVYVEVPDGEMAAREGYFREEFFIDHLHCFSFASLSIMIERAGFTPFLVERLQEPSTKYTLRAFIQA